MDTTFGVVLNWALLSLLSYVANECDWRSLRTPGDYGRPIQVCIWLKQLFSWLVIIITTKILLAIVIYAFEGSLGQLAAWLFRPLQGHPRAELIIVMVACPCLMNVAQFWIQDNFLKKPSATPTSTFREPSNNNNNNKAHRDEIEMQTILFTQDHQDSESESESESEAEAEAKAIAIVIAESEDALGSKQTDFV